MSSGDPLQPRPGEPLPSPPADQPRHESGLPDLSPGYSSPPPPGAVGGSWASSPAVPSSGQYALAGWWSRVGARLILLVGFIAVMALFGAVFSVGFFASEETGTASLVVGLMLSVLAITIVSFLYAPVLMARTNGKTFGRMATGIRVVRATGEPVTFGYAMLREVVVKALLFGILSSITAGIASLLDVLWPLWDDENRALHDFIVNSRVVQD